MERIFGLQKAGRLAKPVATLGVFDGVHRGHASVLHETVGWARDIGGASVVVTFDRHPDTVLRARPAENITSLEHRLSLIEKTGVDFALVLHFTPELAAIEAEDFVREVLVERLGVVGVVLGYNSRFGRRARGDADSLRALGALHGFEVRVPGPFIAEGSPVSSTRIRALIRAGDLEAASRLLGRHVSLRGTVVHGEKRGRNLGFPTANLNLHHELTPPEGVYIGRVFLNGKPLWGLVNIGRRPTFHHEEHARTTVEVHISDFDGLLYGVTLEVELLLHVRSEMRFPSPDELSRQMDKDRRFLEAFKAEADKMEETA